MSLSLNIIYSGIQSSDPTNHFNHHIKDQNAFLNWILHFFSQVDLSLLKNYRNDSRIALETWCKMVREDVRCKRRIMR